ncbi:MAG: carboxypeptidase regulatory-like domain-containing protein [Acidobacteria bacterium]|nr:carboxypeptidase regulatory-like domain-containing protein [Acidobacteriota bacterium]
MLTRTRLVVTIFALVAIAVTAAFVTDSTSAISPRKAVAASTSSDSVPRTTKIRDEKAITAAAKVDLLSISEILNSDGTIKDGTAGSFDPKGYRLELGPNNEPLMLFDGDGCSDKWDDRFAVEGVNGSVHAVAVSGTEVYVGGFFSSVGGVSANNIAKWDGSSWSALGTGTDNIVLSLAVSGSVVYAGGYFQTAGGITVNRIARWGGSSWSAMGSGVTNGVWAIAVSGVDVYVGGEFIEAGGVPANKIARWNGTTWSALGVGLNDTVYTIAVFGSSDIYVGGNFTQAGGLPANRIARWTGSIWLALGSGTSGEVRGIAVSTPNIYVVGNFTTAGGVTVNRVARWSGSSWSALGGGADNVVGSVVVSGANVYVGGVFTTVGGVMVNNIAKWNGSSWSALSTGTNGPIYTIGLSGSNVYVGGEFTTAGCRDSFNFGMYSEFGGTQTPTPTPTPEPTPTPTPEPSPTPTPGDCVTVSLPSSPVTGLPGTNITVPVTVSDLTGREVTSFDFTLEYDSNKLTFVGASNTGTVSSGYMITTFEQTTGQLVVSGFGTTDLTGSGVLLNLTFTVAGDPGSCSTLDLTAFDFNEGTPCSITSNGEACALDRRIFGTVFYANKEEPIGVPEVTMTAAGSPSNQVGTNEFGSYQFFVLGPGAYTITPTKSGDNAGITAFDASLVVQRVVGMTAFTPVQTIVADVSGNGVITSFDAAQIARFVVGNPNTGATGQWRFDPVQRNYPPSSISLFQENYDAFLMGEVSGDWTPEDVGSQRQNRINSEGTEPVAVSLPHTTFGIGAAVNIPMTVGDLTGRGLIAHQFEIAYDPTVIMPDVVPVDLTGTLSSGFNLAYNAATPGLLRVGIYGINDLAGEGTLVNLRFVGVGASGSVSELRFVNFMFNENVDISTVTDGSATVLAPTNAGVEVSGRVMTPDGRGLRNATVTMTDGHGVTRSAVTSSFGYYRFDGVPVGDSFVMSVNSRMYRFVPRVVVVTDTLTDVDFVGIE